MTNRMSMYSVASDALGAPRGPSQQSSQVSTTTLLNAVHNAYLSSQAYALDAGSSLVVNTWLTATQAGADGRVGGTVDRALGARAWEHARRRAEDGTVVLGSLHDSAPSLLSPFLGSLPISIPAILPKALEAIQPFLRCVTPYNPSAARQSGLGVTLTLNLAGELAGASIALSQGGIDTNGGLLNIKAEPGYRAFDVFYYLLTSASTPAEREFLGLKPASSYTLLARSGTYDPPSYLPTADDAAAADDFRAALKEIGIKGSAHRNLISTLVGLLKLGDTLDYGLDSDELEEIMEDASGLLGVEPEVLSKQCSTQDRQTFVGGLYESLVDWVICKANEAIAAQMSGITDAGDADTVSITVIEVPDPVLGKAMAMRGIFDDTQGINLEMMQDGVEVASVGSSIIREMQNAVSEVGPDLGIMSGPAGRERQQELEKREVVLEKVAHAAEDDGFLKTLLFPVSGEGINLGRNGRLDLPVLLNSSRVWYHLSIHPTDDSPASLASLPAVTSAWSAGTVSRQLRAWRLPEWANRRNKHLDFTSDFDFDEFTQRYSALGCRDGRDGIDTWVLERGWSNGEVVVGKERIWMRENAWWEAESMLDLKPMGSHMGTIMPTQTMESGYSAAGSGYFNPGLDASPNGSRDQLVSHQRAISHGNMSQATFSQNRAPSVAPSAMRNVTAGDYGLGHKGDTYKGQVFYGKDGEILEGDPELADGKTLETSSTSGRRRVWVAFVWALTFWIPSFVLRYIGRMKRPDVRMAWREKVVICFLIFIMNAIVIFLIIGFGKVLCPNYDKAWSRGEISHHLGDNDFWVSIHGKVYDISKFWKLQHSDINIKTTKDQMQPLAGMDLSDYFPIPFPVSCRGLGITDKRFTYTTNNTLEYPFAEHKSGADSIYSQSELAKTDWYTAQFLPRIKEYYNGELVWTPKEIQKDGADNQHTWFTYEEKVYDLTNYFHNLEVFDNFETYKFLNSDITDIVKEHPGEDITDLVNEVRLNSQGTSNAANVANSINCIKNHFYVGIHDFRKTPRCEAATYILLAFTIIICAVILVKFLAALRFGSKRRPSPQDKFVICQVPAYTEGEDSLRRAIDSLTALQYDNKRKLICVICDGIIVGQGNDRPTPKIVLDILGVDPKVDPPALPFKSIGTGSEQLNYGKVYSGLYEFEGNVVPYVVVVKCGKESEQAMSKPGNRGKRDSQVLLMSFLNRVHHRSPMNPLELEMFHQINNVIGVDPELYEYIFMVDADTSVREDSLNRLVAACANDARIAGICGETALQNDEKSWWTMIQVYEYFISHHLAKAFESIFGSVTCLPGCFCMYRIRTVDKGRPLIVSDDVIREYSVSNVDTLHMKNLLSLGEDRFLTTIMTKYFPSMTYKFTPDAYCETAAPESWTVLLSQRRRWINSTVHNLMELLRLKEMCGFCCFSMRFVVFLDLFSTVILPSTCFYIGYLIYMIVDNKTQFPLFSIVMLSAVYGLQALIFIIKRQWQHIGWMIIYIIALPIYSFVLPVYSFWNQDNFSWGNTRIVVGEKGDKKIVAVGDTGFDPRSIPLQRWDDYALANNLPGRRGGPSDREYLGDDQYEMDDIKSVYSSAPQGSFHGGALSGRPSYMPPSPSNSGMGMGMQRQSHLPYVDHRQSMASFGGDIQRRTSPYQDGRASAAGIRAGSNLSPALGFGGNRTSTALGLRTPMSDNAMRSSTSFDFQNGSGGGPDDAVVVDAIQSVLREVDLDTVTKKQVRALVEQRLQTELTGEKRAFMDRQIDHELANM
ncbi:probable chitin synthase [Cephalotrichum gorgonifer]|uniref:chitin synthase n=1 Tax=Cephalotrichum gorgonifer TaxID=2041049 RepID=A0AAE8N3T0_9PEZI|nr:probable chitin synthase [Cephalotrichum gorgonifer]